MLHSSVNTVPAHVEVKASPDAVHLQCSGDWTFSGIGEVDATMRRLTRDFGGNVEVNTTRVRQFDTAGAWLIERMRRYCASHDIAFQHVDHDARRTRLVEVIRAEPEPHAQTLKPFSRFFTRPFEAVGRFMYGLFHDFILICNVIGAAIRGPQMKVGKRGGIRFTSIINHIDHMGLRAIPVIAVMSFLIGAIITQQGAFQLRAFGEELLTINLLSILLLREIGVLLTAIMVAGRTGSAITAELGSMKMREEIDALRVIGLNPTAVLVFPRMMALVIALPILALLADFAGLAGGLLVSWFYIDVPPQQFISTLRTAIDHSTLFSGLIKAPFMAIVIALISAIEGMKVSGSAESLGYHTTSAVVRSIFVVIVLDGLFAIFYAAIDY